MLRLERGEEVMSTLADVAREHGISGAEVSGIGAFERSEVGFYNLERKDYDRMQVEEETEVLSVLGNLSVMDDGPRPHLHVTLSRRDGSALGGHLFSATVSATLELFIRETPSELRRVPNADAGLPLLDL